MSDLIRRAIAKTASYTLKAMQPDRPGTVFTNRGASGAVTFTLPTAAPALNGYFYDFVVQANQSLIVAAAAANTLHTIGDATADNVGFQTASAKLGRAIRAYCDGTVWYAVPLTGLSGFCVDGTELTLLVGGVSVTASAAELNYLDITTLGTGAASKAVVLDANGDYAMPSGGVLALARAALVAAGSSATDAAALTQQVQIVTGADAAKGVALPAAATTEGPYIIINDAAAALLVYPVNGGNDNINGLAEDAAFRLAGGEVGIFVPTSATQWYAATRGAQGTPTPMTRSTVTNAGTLTAAQTRGRVLYQDASGGNVTMTTRTGTETAADFPELRVGDAVQLFLASNHASNTSTIAGGTDVTLVGSGAVINTGGQFLLIKTAATTFDLVRVG